MDEKTIRSEAYDKMAKKLMEKFMDAYTDGFCALLQKQVDAVVEELKERETDDR